MSDIDALAMCTVRAVAISSVENSPMSVGSANFAQLSLAHSDPNHTDQYQKNQNQNKMAQNATDRLRPSFEQNSFSNYA